jgi:hypothetical protein
MLYRRSKTVSILKLTVCTSLKALQRRLHPMENRYALPNMVVINEN